MKSFSPRAVFGLVAVVALVGLALLAASPVEVHALALWPSGLWIEPSVTAHFERLAIVTVASSAALVVLAFAAGWIKAGAGSWLRLSSLGLGQESLRSSAAIA